MTGEKKIAKEREGAARKICFERCREGEWLDLENGCVSICKSADECTGWRAVLHLVEVAT